MVLLVGVGAAAAAGGLEGRDPVAALPAGRAAGVLGVFCGVGCQRIGGERDGRTGWAQPTQVTDSVRRREQSQGWRRWARSRNSGTASMLR